MNTQTTLRKNGQSLLPRADVVERADGYHFWIELPGVDPAKLEVSFENGSLTIVGRAEPILEGESNWLRREFALGEFRRTFRLPDSIDPSGITAEFEHGVAHLFVPKAAPAARKIAIRVV